MDNALLAKQLDIVKNTPPGESVAFTVEGAGILRAFVRARGTRDDISAGESALHRKIGGLLSTWEASGPEVRSTPPMPGKEKRTQLMLRGAIDKVLNEQFSEVTEEEVKLLHATYDVFSKRCDNDPDSNPRLVGMLKSTLDTLAANEDKLQIGNDDTSVFDTTSATNGAATSVPIANTIMADDAFTNIQRSSITVIDEVNIDLNVRIFEYTGGTSISGDVPSDVLVKVIDGGIVVSGFVAGYLVADGDIEIGGNIQGGGAISNSGSITLEHSLMGAALVAKRGSITCNHLESPERVFAWETLKVNGPCMDATITAGAIQIAGSVTAANLNSCGHITCEGLSVSSRSATVVYLADHIKCDAYSRGMADELDNSYRDIGTLTKKIAEIEEMDRFTLRLIHNTYRTALYYLLGGIQSASGATNLQGKQLRKLYVGQLISVVEGITKFYTDAHEYPEEYGEESVNNFDEQMTSTRERIKIEIEALPEDVGTNHRRVLLERTSQIRHLAKIVHREFVEEKATTALGSMVANARNSWRTEYEQTDRELRELVQSFGVDKKLLDRIEHEPETLEQLLVEIIEEKKGGGSADDQQRLESPLVRLLRTTADRYKRTIEKNMDTIVDTRKKLSDAARRLDEEAAVKFADKVPGAASVEASHFGAGVVITASPVSRRGMDTTIAKVIVIAKEINSPTRFDLRSKLIPRQV
ncbi:MAG: FapA family protein [Candidatus Hydrogenedentota bacterium]